MQKRRYILLKKRLSQLDPYKVFVFLCIVFVLVFVLVKAFEYSVQCIGDFLKKNYASVVTSFEKPQFDSLHDRDSLRRFKDEYDVRMLYLGKKIYIATSTVDVSMLEYQEILKLFRGASVDLSLQLGTTTIYSFTSFRHMFASTSIATSTRASVSTTTTSSEQSHTVSMNQTSTSTRAMLNPKATKDTLWPVSGTVYPKQGAILPFKRVVAYYGNLYSKKMGVLGEYEPDTVIQKLNTQVKEWELADPATPVQPALHYIAVVAQGAPGGDGMYRARMPDEHIEKVLEMAKKNNAIVFLDVQVALSNLRAELPRLETYLKLPHVHLGIDPEFSMKTGKKPGSVIGTMDAADINYAASFLADVVQKYDLPPKILTFYRFTRGMVTNHAHIKTVPEVQLVLVMDGWGHQARKVNTYKQFIYPEPIQFTGYKLFYKNDLKHDGSRLMTPKEVIDLTPAPIYIQYQ